MDREPIDDSEFNILTQVYEGMSIVDVNHERVGSVDFVYLGAASEVDNEFGTGPASISEADMSTREEPSIDFAFGGGLSPEESGENDTLRGRLMRDGFIRIDGGILGSDLFVISDQIASVDGDRVILNVKKDELIREG